MTAHIVTLADYRMVEQPKGMDVADAAALAARLRAEFSGTQTKTDADDDGGAIVALYLPWPRREGAAVVIGRAGTGWDVVDCLAGTAPQNVLCGTMQDVLRAVAAIFNGAFPRVA
ncbi:MAG: hypothetical protein WBQ75_15285 [Acetobacteraceae bacterium]